MIEIIERNAVNELLKPYIEGYGQVKINHSPIRQKELLPWPGASLLFVNQPFFISDIHFSSSCMFGIRETPTCLKWLDDNLDIFAVKFKPHGLSHFLNFTVNKIKDRVMNIEEVWPHNGHIKTLDNIPLITSSDEKIEQIEHFLVTQLNLKLLDDEGIISLINEIMLNPRSDLKKLKEQIPLSSRQFERRFKELTGVNLTTFVRICRFFYTKMHLLNDVDTLTELGYDAGYFDQAHFSKEFKKFSSSSPKHFPLNFPLFNIISDEKLI